MTPSEPRVVKCYVCDDDILVPGEHLGRAECRMCRRLSGRVDGEIPLLPDVKRCPNKGARRKDIGKSERNYHGGRFTKGEW